VTSEPSEDQLDRIKSQIRADADAARQRAPLPPRTPAVRDAAPAATGSSIADLARFGGTAFVDHAYRAILKRPPDPAGLERQMALLGSGASKIEVIGDLRYSAEGRVCATPIAGLLPRYLLAKLGRVPLLGAVVQWLIALLSLPHLLRHQRATEASLAVRFEQTAAALHAAEQRDAELRSEITQLSDRLVQAETYLETLRQHVEALDANVVSLRHLSLTMNHWALQVRQSIDAIESAEAERQAREDEVSAATIARARSRDTQRIPRLQAWAEKLAKKMPAAATILDIGGGSDWIAMLGARGWKVSSIETNAALHRQARERRLDVTFGSPRSLLARVADESIDALTLSWSERSLAEMTPHQVALEAQRTLKRGGVLLIDVGHAGGPVEASLSDAALGAGFGDAEMLDNFAGKALMFERS
jgi:SAM-dependent methyltransferase